MRASQVALAALLAAGAGAQSIELQVTMPPGGIAFGEAFELVVKRELIGADAVAGPEPFDERQLGPLHVELVAAEQQPHPRWTMGTETIRFRARCFVVGEVKIGPVTMQSRATDGKVATSGQLVLNVRSSLPEPAGAFEWPGDVRDLPSPSWPWVVAGAVLLTTCVWWWRRPRAVGEPAFAVVQPAMPTALRELRALAVPGDGADAAVVVAFHQDVKRLVRQHCRERFDLAADVRTSEELLRAVGDDRRAAACLLACDLVLFAATLPAAAERARTLAAAIAFAEGAP